MGTKTSSHQVFSVGLERNKGHMRVLLLLLSLPPHLWRAPPVPDCCVQKDTKHEGQRWGNGVDRIICNFCPGSTPTWAFFPRPDPRGLASHLTLQDDGRSPTRKPHRASPSLRDWARLTSDPREVVLELICKAWGRSISWSFLSCPKIYIMPGKLRTGTFTQWQTPPLPTRVWLGLKALKRQA